MIRMVCFIGSGIGKIAFKSRYPRDLQKNGLQIKTIKTIKNIKFHASGSTWNLDTYVKLFFNEPLRHQIFYFDQERFLVYGFVKKLIRAEIFGILILVKCNSQFIFHTGNSKYGYLF